MRFPLIFAGHRPRNVPGRTARELEETAPLIDRALIRFKDHASRSGSLLEAHSGAAEGCDLIFATTALKHNVPLHLHLPQAMEDFRKGFTDPVWHRVQSLLDRADRILIPQNPQPPPRCYAVLNEELLTLAAGAILVCDDAPAAGPGGTAEVLESARSLELPHIRIHPGTLQLSSHGFPDEGTI